MKGKKSIADEAQSKIHIPLTGEKEKISFFGRSLCTSLLCTELQTVASHFIN